MPLVIIARLVAITLAPLIGVLTLVAAASAFSGPQSPSSEHTMTYYVAPGPVGTGFRSGDRDLAAWAFELWAGSAAHAFRFVPAASENSAIVRLYWASANGSTYGETRRVTVNGERGAEVFVRPDVEGLSPDIAARAAHDDLWRDLIVFMTCVHEIGHALDLDHTADPRDIMYSFGYGGDIVEYFARYRRQLKARADLRALSVLSASDVQHLRARHP
jgi:hypothetical protein